MPLFEEKPENYSGAPRPPVAPAGGKSIFGGILFGIGILIMGLSGLCTGGLALIALPDAIRSGNGSEIFGMLAIGSLYGGIPFGIGFLLFWLGKRMRRKQS
jgi:hypothetical protein